MEVLICFNRKIIEPLKIYIYILYNYKINYRVFIKRHISSKPCLIYSKVAVLRGTLLISHWVFMGYPVLDSPLSDWVMPTTVPTSFSSHVVQISPDFYRYTVYTFWEVCTSFIGQAKWFLTWMFCSFYQFLTISSRLHWNHLQAW